LPKRLTGSPHLHPHRSWIPLVIVDRREQQSISTRGNAVNPGFLRLPRRATFYSENGGSARIIMKQLGLSQTNLALNAPSSVRPVLLMTAGSALTPRQDFRPSDNHVGQGAHWATVGRSIAASSSGPCPHGNTPLGRDP
jgi:hypothetical protein